MNKNFQTQDAEKRLSLSFHRTFALSRDSIRVILDLASSEDGGSPITNQQILEQSNLGTIYVEAMPRYAQGCGLLSKERYKTPFGQISSKYDPLLINPSTQWLMHYYLSAPHGPGPVFWNKLVTTLFIPGQEFTVEDLLSCIREGNESIKSDTLSEAKTAFIGTYTKKDGLGNLELISESDDKRKYQVNYPSPPPLWAMAVAFIDYCQAQYPGASVINLSSVLDESDFAKIFMVGVRRINLMLSRMQEIGYVNLFTSVPPYGIALLQTDPIPLLEKMYVNEEPD